MLVARRTAIVHVGLEKTGTTSIQHWLAGQRDALLAAGCLFPKSPGALNHTKLVAAAMDDAAIDNLKAHQMAAQGRSAKSLRARFQREFDQELKRHKGWTKLVISSELITSRLHMPSEIDRLVAFLRPYVDDIRFVIFLRRQAELAVSRFSSALRAGHDSFDGVFADLSANSFLSLPPGRSADDMVEFYDYDTILSRFERVEGATTQVVVFNPPGGRIDPVRCFAEAIGIPMPGEVPSDLHLNSAISAEGQYVIAALNQSHDVLFPSGLRNQPYHVLLRRIEAELAGQKRTVTRAEAEVFQAHFDASNARVADRYADGRAMFRSGFDSYPVEVDYSAIPAAMSDTLAAYAAQADALVQSEFFSTRLIRLGRQAASLLGLR